jgi:hypothetical protein
MPWKMFLIEPTVYCRKSLRRHFNSEGKPLPDPNHYHDAEVVIDEKFFAGEEDPEGGTLGDEYRDDPRWPKSCACGYVFTPKDHFQMNVTRLWEGAPDGELYPIRENPPGAIWAADWFPVEGPNGNYTGPDGKVWCVMLPGGVEWIIYSYASGNPKSKWHVEGAVPNITVSPSIAQVGVYHGFIKGGVISEDCEGRKFPKFPSTV